MIEYILNHRTHNPSRLHIRVDGMTNEQCNLDQLQRYVVLPELPPDGNYNWCARCRVSAGKVSAEVAQ